MDARSKVPWFSTMPVSDSVPAIITTVSAERMSGLQSICAMARIAPRILAAAGPAGEHAQFRARTDSEEEKQTGLRQVERHHFRPNGSTGKSAARDEQRDGRESGQPCPPRGTTSSLMSDSMRAINWPKP